MAGSRRSRTRASTATSCSLPPRLPWPSMRRRPDQAWRGAGDTGLASGFDRVVRGGRAAGRRLARRAGHAWSSLSVTLRSDLIGQSGVPGDFELVQMATAVAAFCFLPYCQLRRGNIFVDTLHHEAAAARAARHRCLLGCGLRAGDGADRLAAGGRCAVGLRQRREHHGAATAELSADRALRGAGGAGSVPRLSSAPRALCGSARERVCAGRHRVSA